MELVNEKPLIEKLVKLVKRSALWSREGNVVKLLDLYNSCYPEPPTPRDIEQHGIGGAEVVLSRLNKDLEDCFTSDRSLWPDQRRLVVPRKQGLRTGPLSDKLRSTLKFWFSHCVRIRSVQAVVDQAGQNFVVFSEPLFFYCKTLQGYFRFLEVDHDEPFKSGDSKILVDRARDCIRRSFEAQSQANSISSRQKKSSKAIAKERAITRELEMFVAGLNLVPTRNYLPAGDSVAAGKIRGWFRDSVKYEIGEKEARGVSELDSTKSNLVILASRSSLPLLARFQKTAHELRIHLTDKGIMVDDKNLDDDIGDEDFGTAYVVVTNWTFDTDNVHTYIASNHTRALGAVAELLVNDDLLDHITLVDAEGRIPRRFQLAFKVPLLLHEMQAGKPVLLPELGGAILPYGNHKGEGPLSHPARTA